MVVRVSGSLTKASVIYNYSDLIQSPDRSYHLVSKGNSVPSSVPEAGNHYALAQARDLGRYR